MGPKGMGFKHLDCGGCAVIWIDRLKALPPAKNSIYEATGVELQFLFAFADHYEIELKEATGGLIEVDGLTETQADVFDVNFGKVV